MKKEKSDDNTKVNDLSAMGKIADWNDPLFPQSTKEDTADLDSLGNIPVPIDGKFYAVVKKGKRNAIVQFSIGEGWAQEHSKPDWSPISFPSTLAAFREWWDGLNKHSYKAVFPRSMFFGQGNVATMSDFAALSTIEEPALSKVEIWDKPLLSLEAKLERNSLEYTGVGRGLYILPIRRFIYVEVTPRMIADQFRWKVGDFNTSLGDLAQATKDLDSLEIDDIEKFIAAEAAKGSQVFEAFGMKIPAEQVTVWGVAVVLCVQLYLFIYLRQLSGKLSQNDAGWDVPWIGMDTSTLTRIIFFGTVFLLPCFAVGLLALHTSVHAGRWVRLENITYFSISFCLSLLLGVLTWTNRPKLQQRSGPSDTVSRSGQVAPDALGNPAVRGCQTKN